MYLLRFVLVCCAFVWASHAIETKATNAYLIDADTGQVLFEKSADALAVPSSMTKIMTAYLVFDHMKKGDISPDTELPVSEKAWRKGGSKMFVKVGDMVRVDDLLKGVIVQSGNDASITLAEGLAGDEDAFAEEMTRVAHELGAKDVNFINATGWPDDGHVCTAKDLAIIAQATLKNFPDEYKAYYPLPEFTYAGIRQPNRNPLLSQGADGMKTGHTDAGGYSVVATKEHNGRRLILVVNGHKTQKERAQEAAKLMAWGFSSFEKIDLFHAGQTVEMADVWGGDKGQVPLVTTQDASVTLPKRQVRDMVVKAVFESPVQAPIAENETVGRLVVTVEGAEKVSFPLVTAESVGEAGFFKRIRNAIYYLFFGQSE